MPGPAHDRTIGTRGHVQPRTLTNHVDKMASSSVPAATRRVTAAQASIALSIDPSGQRFCVLQQGALHLLRANSTGDGVPLLAADGTAVAVRSARFGPTGATLVTGGDDKRVRVWDVASATCLRSWLHHKKVACVDLSAEGETVLFADRFGEVYSVPLGAAENATPTLMLGHLSPVSHLRLAPSGNSVLTADREGHVRSSCYPHAFVIESFYLLHTSPLQVMLPTATAPLILTAAAEGREICLWKYFSGAPPPTRLQPSGCCCQCRCSARPSPRTSRPSPHAPFSAHPPPTTRGQLPRAPCLWAVRSRHLGTVSPPGP